MIGGIKGKNMRLKSLRTRMLLAFCLIAIIPNIIISIISLGNTVDIVKRKVTELTQSNLEQVNRNMNLTLAGYEDLLLQLYTDENIVELIEGINHGENISLYRSQLIRRLRQAADVKGYIASVMFIPKEGEPIFYDKLTSASTKSSWLDTCEYSKQELYEMISSSNRTIMMPTRGFRVSGQDYYLFHMAHRLINYKNINKDIGILIFSLKADMLDRVCNESVSEEIAGVNFLLNENNEILSFPNNYGVGSQLYGKDDSAKEKKAACETFIEKADTFQGKKVIINSIVASGSNWTIINVADQDLMLGEIQIQKNSVKTMIMISLVVSFCLSFLFSSQLTTSIQRVKHIMQVVSDGDLSARVQIEKKMTEEIEVIARQFNYTMDELEDSIQKEKVATARQKDAEIKFLEAQINPHFLYNTLDTINWMAIDKEQYEISNVINALAHILRYGIEENNKMVPISRDIEWLKQYIFLQQSRIMTEIECRIKVEPDLMNCYIHKLLLQPFVENAMIHGVDRKKSRFILGITIEKSGDNLQIMISDNGKGMEESKIKEIACVKAESEQKGHIGVRNAIERIRMYYGDDASVEVKSVLGEGTVIVIVIPEIKGEGEKYENRNC